MLIKRIPNKQPTKNLQNYSLSLQLLFDSQEEAIYVEWKKSDNPTS